MRLTRPVADDAPDRRHRVRARSGADETLTQYVIDGSRCGTSALPARPCVPFVAGGAGYIRDLHEGNELVETGTEYHARGRPQVVVQQPAAAARPARRGGHVHPRRRVRLQGRARTVPIGAGRSCTCSNVGLVGQVGFRQLAIPQLATVEGPLGGCGVESCELPAVATSFYRVIRLLVPAWCRGVRGPAAVDDVLDVGAALWPFAYRAVRPCSDRSSSGRPPPSACSTRGSACLCRPSVASRQLDCAKARARWLVSARHGALQSTRDDACRRNRVRRA